MKFSIAVHDTEVTNLLGRLIEITGIDAWTRRFEWLQREAAGNTVMEDWLRERCSIEWTFGDVLRNREMVSQQPFVLNNVAQYELVAFAAGTVRSYERLSERGKRRLRGTLLDGLKEDKGLSSVQHEITTAVHLMIRGFDVEFHDMEHGGGVDFLARKADIEIEVECKMFSADVGRKIHRRRSATLYKALESLLNQTYRSISTGMIVQVTIPDRLTASPDQHLGIERALRSALLNGNAITQTEHCDIQIVDFLMNESPFNKAPTELSREDIENFVRTRTGRSNSTLMIFFSPGQRAVVLSLESRKSDEVLSGMLRQLRDAAKCQLTKERPSFLAVQLHGLTAEQLTNIAQSDSSWLGNATGLQVMTSDFLQSPSRGHIHTVVYRSHGTISDDRSHGVTQTNGVAYIIKNRNHALCDDPQYSVFSL